jgi:hypothetical protein
MRSKAKFDMETRTLKKQHEDGAAQNGEESGLEICEQGIIFALQVNVIGWGDDTEPLWKYLKEYPPKLQDHGRGLVEFRKGAGGH